MRIDHEAADCYERMLSAKDAELSSERAAHATTAQLLKDAEQDRSDCNAQWERVCGLLDAEKKAHNETESRRAIQHEAGAQLRLDRALLMAALDEITQAPNFGTGSFYNMIAQARSLFSRLRTAPAEPPVANGGTEG